MNLTSFLKTGTYLSLKIGSHEKMYILSSQKRLGTEMLF